MQLSMTLISLALATTALALPTTVTDDNTVDQLTVSNKCSFPVYHWLVASNTTDLGVIEAGEQKQSTQLHDPTIGSAIKISTEANSLYTETPIFHFSYNQVGEMLYYDLSSSGGIDAKWKEKKISLTGDKTDFETIVWAGEPTGTKAYHGHADLKLTLCA